jgi:hypothetical protein
MAIKSPFGDLSGKLSKEVLELCLLTIKEFADLGLPAEIVGEGSLNFDCLLPHLISLGPLEDLMLVSKRLCAHRFLADCLNRGTDQYTPTLKATGLLGPWSQEMTASKYKDLNIFSRVIDNSPLLEIYLRSTVRVAYRASVLEDADRSRLISLSRGEIQVVNRTSALLLLDDDIFDYEEDLLAGKKTILNQFLLIHKMSFEEAMTSFLVDWKSSDPIGYSSSNLMAFDQLYLENISACLLPDVRMS